MADDERTDLRLMMERMLARLDSTESQLVDIKILLDPLVRERSGDVATVREIRKDVDNAFAQLRDVRKDIRGMDDRINRVSGRIEKWAAVGGALLLLFQFLFAAYGDRIFG